MYELAKIGGYVFSPLTLVLGLGLLAALLSFLRRPRAAFAAATAGFGLLWLLSLPVVSSALEDWLAADYPPVPMQATPAADAILVLGGALTGAHPPTRPYFNLGPATGRVWYAAQLYRAGKAPLVVVAGGNQPWEEGVQPESAAIESMLRTLGVPGTAILREGRSRNTRENAAYSLELIRQAKGRRVIVVTSALHMKRALATFREIWGPSFELIPWPVDHPERASAAWKMWLPSLESLLDVTKASKEVAGLYVFGIIRNVTR